MPDKIHQLLNDWFGTLGFADLPNSDRTNLWFGDDDEVKQKLAAAYKEEYQQAAQGHLLHWAETPRGRLALIILLDQVSRFLYKHSKSAYAHDAMAQKLCEEGMKLKMDSALTLIERVFFYMPLVHAEDAEKQERSIRLYQELVSLSMSETTQIYQLFLAYAYAHFRLVKEFGRFPQRNRLLQRTSTDAELAFLKNT